MKIIHLSDIHIGQSNNCKKFKTIVEWLINKKTWFINCIVVITGDIVDDGVLWQYRQAGTLINQLRNAGFVVLCCPGNHDYGENGIIESRKCINYFKKYISNGIDYPHCEILDSHAIILLDSMMGEMEEIDFWGAQGKLGEDQLRNLDQILNEISDNHKVVLALHHHPFYYSYFLKLRDSFLLKKIIVSRVNCVLFGHKHVEERLYPSMDIDMVHAAGSIVERGYDGKMTIPVIDLNQNSIKHYSVS